MVQSPIQAEAEWNIVEKVATAGRKESQKSLRPLSTFQVYI